ncbi:hypothetical protein T492DRAFT_969997 [Pavlovales sp. CCMP2436]|nr:hypothetical protein T492DRAFT_969997 [Pavlovales sp. CCMP2436]|mmetsp:Transcript_44428/g.110062  ORF Transcript_44428/g.110062 Transcript_44428/m.110062 type:complete len:196 (+) Transcript_44428:28-615(+)
MTAKMSITLLLACVAALAPAGAAAFAPAGCQTSARIGLARASRTSASMLFNSDRSRRSAGSDDRKVTLKKPLGLELVDGPGRSVIIADIIAGSSGADAARRGLIAKGDIVVMCSATFGDQMWSCRGVGRDRVVKAISVRSGDVSLVLETPDKFKSNSAAAMAADEKMRQSKEKEVTSLQDQIKSEEKGKKSGRWF